MSQPIQDASSTVEPSPTTTKFQFDLSALLFSTATAAMAMAYFRIFDTQLAIVAVMVAVAYGVIGAMVGWWLRRGAACSMWGMLGSVFAMMCGLTVAEYQPLVYVVWAVLGGAVGVGVAASTGVIWQVSLFGAMIGAAVMAVLWWLDTEVLSLSYVGVADVVTAFGAGGALGLIVEAIVRLDDRGRLR